ncbi:hypothetical protein ACTFIR_011940 [Dictyostelium discoideum]
MLSYKPNAGLSNWNTIDNVGPLNSIPYSFVDQQGLVSHSDVVYFSERPNPPVYTGADINKGLNQQCFTPNTQFPTGYQSEFSFNVNFQLNDGIDYSSGVQQLLFLKRVSFLELIIFYLNYKPNLKNKIKY